MDAHAHDHDAHDARPEVTGTMGFAMLLGMLGMVVALVGTLRADADLLTTGGIAGAAGIALAVAAIGLGSVGGRGARGWLAAVATGVLALVLWAVAGPNI